LNIFGVRPTSNVRTAALRRAEDKAPFTGKTPPPAERLYQNIITAKNAKPKTILMPIPLQVLGFRNHRLISDMGTLYIYRRLISLERGMVFDALWGRVPVGPLSYAEIEAWEIKDSEALFNDVATEEFSPQTILVHPFFKSPEGLNSSSSWDTTLCRRYYEEAVHPVILKTLESVMDQPGGLVVDLGGGEGVLAERIINDYSPLMLVVERNIKQAERARERIGAKAKVVCGDARELKEITVKYFNGLRPRVIVMSGLLTLQVLMEEEAKAILKTSYETLEPDGRIVLSGRMPVIWTAKDLGEAGFVIEKSFDLERFLSFGNFFSIIVIRKEKGVKVDFDRLGSEVLRNRAGEKGFEFWEKESKESRSWEKVEALRRKMQTSALVSLEEGWQGTREIWT
jgi:hypothetical protein